MAWIARLVAPSEFALLLVLTSFAMATASTCAAPCWPENGQASASARTFVGQQWLWLYDRHHGRAVCRRRAGRAPAALRPCRPPPPCAAIAPIARDPRVASAQREEKPGEQAGNATHLPQHRRGAESPRSCTSSPCSCSSIASLPVRHAAHHFMTDELRFSQSILSAFSDRSPPQAGSSAPWRIRWLLRRMSSKALLY